MTDIPDLSTEAGRELISKAIEAGMLRHLRGGHYVLSGTMTLPRVQIRTLVTMLGGAVHPTVTRRTACVITGSNSERTTKVVEARRRNVRIMTEAEFMEQVFIEPRF